MLHPNPTPSLLLLEEQMLLFDSIPIAFVILEMRMIRASHI